MLCATRDLVEGYNNIQHKIASALGLFDDNDNTGRICSCMDALSNSCISLEWAESTCSGNPTNTWCMADYTCSNLDTMCGGTMYYGSNDCPEEVTLADVPTDHVPDMGDIFQELLECPEAPELIDPLDGFSAFCQFVPGELELETR